MTKKKGRPLRYNEETERIHLFIPKGAKAGIVQLVKQYLELYQKRKQLEQLKNKQDDTDN
jgi:hypothetical protein